MHYIIVSVTVFMCVVCSVLALHAAALAVASAM